MSPGELWVWLRRIGHCRGFGVQSPSAYAFIRYVVNEHYPYYAYADLCELFPTLTHRRRKLYELYLRLANHMQADLCWTNLNAHEALRHYIQAGCRRTRLTTRLALTPGPPSPLMAIVKPPRQDSGKAQKDGKALEDATRQYLEQAAEGSVLVVEGIGQRPEAKALWLKVRQSMMTSVCFDLHYCGIAFKDKRFKQSHIVNF